MHAHTTNHRLTVLLGAMALLLLWGSASPVWAGLGAQGAELRLNYAEGEVTLTDSTRPGDREGKQRLSSPLALEVLPDHTFTLVLEDYNPLLWQYEVKVEEALTDEYKEAQNAAKIVSELVGALTGTPETEALNEAGDTEFMLDGSGEQKTLKDVCLGGVNLKKLVKDLEKIDEWAGRTDQLIRQSLHDAATARSKVSGWEITAKKQIFQQIKEELEQVDRQALAGTMLDGRCAALRGLIFRVIDRAETKLEALTTLQELLLQSSEDKVLKEIKIDSRKKVTITLVVKRTKQWPGGLSLETRPSEVVIEIKPRFRIDLSYLAPAAVYSFVKNPEYATVAEGDKFRIQLTEDDYQELDVALMMMISPRAWDFDNVRFHAQLGITPKDDPGLYAGFAIGIYDLFTLGGGITYQRVNRLGRGLEVDQLLDAEDELKIDKQFKAGFYLHITVPLTIKKDGAT